MDGSYRRPYLLFVQYWGVNELVQARSSLQLTLSSCSGEVIISLLARILPEFINWGRNFTAYSNTEDIGINRIMEVFPPAGR